MRLRYSVQPYRVLPRAVERGLVGLVLTATFVPGIWLLVGFIVVGHNAIAGIVFGGFFLCGAGALAWTTWGRAYEVVLDGDEVQWRGVMATGRAPLRDLRHIQGPLMPGRPVEFVFTRVRSFQITPASGLAEFVDRLQTVAPHIHLQFPTSVWRHAQWRRGVLEESI